jgi:hypothetical protein
MVPEINYNNHINKQWRSKDMANWQTVLTPRHELQKDAKFYKSRIFIQ